MVTPREVTLVERWYSELQNIIEGCNRTTSILDTQNWNTLSLEVVFFSYLY